MSLVGKLKIGTEVIVETTQIPNKRGVVKFVGNIQGKESEFIGVELDQALGKNNGEFDNKQYFTVEKKDKKGLYGVFVRMKSVKLLNGTAVSDLLNVSHPKQLKSPPAKAERPPAKMEGNKKGSNSNLASKNKLSQEMAESTEVLDLKEEVQKLRNELNSYKTLDTVKEVQELRAKLKEVEELNRNLKMSSQKIKYSVDTSADEKMKDLASQMSFFKSQKDNSDKQNAELKKKITGLKEELEEHSGKDEVMEKLIVKVDSLESKCEKYRQQLEAAKTELKNTKMLGGNKSSEQLNQDVRLLNEMVSLLESDIGQERNKNAQLQAELGTVATKLQEHSKMERKINSLLEEIEMLKAEVDGNSEAATFAEKLTLDMIRKEEGFKEKAIKLKEYVERAQVLENQAIEAKEMIELQTAEMESQEEEIAKIHKEKSELQAHIALLNGQIYKYKLKIRELSENSAVLEDTPQELVETSFPKYGADVYQHKYYELQQISQKVSQRSIENEVSYSILKNNVGVYLANLVEALPESYKHKLYPEAMHMLVKIKCANDKLYLLFEACCTLLKEKPDIYSKENSNLVEWLVMVLDQIPVLYSLLMRIQLTLTTAESQEQIADVMAHYVLKDEVSRIDMFAAELLRQIGADNIDVDIDFSPFIEPVDVLDKICAEGKKLSVEFNNKLQLCTECMICVHKLFESIKLFKLASDLGETAQVDPMFQGFIRILRLYLKECCTNPHIRMKSEMKDYLKGLDLVANILRQIHRNQGVHELASLFSGSEDIKLLKDTIVTTQFHAKELIADLDQIQYPNVLSKVETRLSGRAWQDKLRQIKESLGKFQETLVEKEELQKSAIELKTKVAVLEKEMKDRQSTKEVHQKRIGELQLRVEQGAFVETELKRQTQRIKSMEEASKLLQNDLQLQGKKRKELEEELKKSKQKYDNFHTDSFIQQRKAKVPQQLATDQVTNLSLFKAVVKEAALLRHSNLKAKLHSLKHSIVLNPIPNQHPNDQSKAATLRRELLSNIAVMKVGESRIAEMLRTVSKFELLKFEKQGKKKQMEVQFGSVSVGDATSGRISAGQTWIVSC